MLRSFSGSMVQAPHREILLKLVISFHLIFLSVAVASGSETPSVNIKVDQVGYPISARKIAVVSAPARTFVVKRASDNATVYQGKLSASATDANSGDTVEAADFSSLQQPGMYYLEVPGIGRSWTFYWAGCIFPHLLSRDASVLRTALRDCRGPWR